MNFEKFALDFKFRFREYNLNYQNVNTGRSTSKQNNSIYLTVQETDHG